MTTNIPAGWESLINRLRNKEGAGWTAPPLNYEVFISEATNLFIAKSTDYDDRYLKGLASLDARTIWAWEVNKKLDRLRTWIKRGELQVKGEGVRNSVDDLFVYTVQYVDYIHEVIHNGAPAEDYLEAVKENRRGFFRYRSKRLTAVEWVEFLIEKGLIDRDELLLQNLILCYMGAVVTVEDWQQSIRTLLKK